jgi:hypothetical protein
MAVDPILYRDGQSFIETDFMGGKKDVRGAEFVAVLKPKPTGSDTAAAPLFTICTLRLCRGTSAFMRPVNHINFIPEKPGLSN